jgi:hypothetical protein
MKRLLFIFSMLISIGVVASNDYLRTMVVSQFRNLVDPLFESGEATQPQFDSFYTEMVEELPIQQKAEKALELAINRFVGAPAYVLENAQRWRGEISSNKQLETLINIAINSPLIEVRMAGFEIYLSQFDLDKTPEQVNILLQRYYEKPHKSGPWALWSMALIGARGIDRERIFNELLFATKESDDYIRGWAVDALAKFGGEEIISPLLDIAKFDSSPIIQERAFCGLAQSGTLHVLERYSALSGLLEIAKDSSSSQQQISWTYQALKEISNFYDIEDNPEEWEKRMLDVDMLRY